MFTFEKFLLKVDKYNLESYSDYPVSVRHNAKRALDWAEKNGWGRCGTAVGKQRANQLAKGEPISLDTIKRMHSFLSRHESDLEASTSYSDGCGKLMYDAWGGKAALGWSNNKLKQLGLSAVETITCKNCGWTWDLKDGGSDPYICHKCGYNNE
jgi:hypothetical protein